jgi:hypothetical protein
MTATKQLVSSAQALLDEEVLIREARSLSRRRRRRRGLLIISLVAVACLIAFGVVRISSVATSSSHSDPSAQGGLTCPHARVKLLGVTGLPGAAVSAGMLVRASLSSSVACEMSGYPRIGALLTNHSTAIASDARFGIFGGLTKANAPLPQLSITSRPRVVSFTIQFDGGDGHACPRINEVRMTLPGSRGVMTTRTTYQVNIGTTHGMGIYCGYLRVTPLVKGSSGSTLGLN